jgi:hypothetical protein
MKNRQKCSPTHLIKIMRIFVLGYFCKFEKNCAEEAIAQFGHPAQQSGSL